MGKNKKRIFVIVLFFLICLLMQTSVCYTIVAKEWGFKTDVISIGVAIILSIFQVLQYVVPILYLAIRLIVNYKRKNGNNTKKNIVSYIFIAMAICLSLVGIGQLILTFASSQGYSSMSAGYITYNGKIV